MNLDTMPAEVYVMLLDAMSAGCNVEVLEILDRYTVGGLKQKHWVVFEMAVAFAAATFQDALNQVRNAQQTMQCAAEWSEILARRSDGI